MEFGMNTSAGVTKNIPLASIARKIIIAAITDLTDPVGENA
jgi:hypothetical protein